MHTLTKSGKRWTVGYWTPFDAGLEDPWIAVATLDTAEDAAHLVSYLNGSPGNAFLLKLFAAGGIKFGEK